MSTMSITIGGYHWEPLWQAVKDQDEASVVFERNSEAYNILANSATEKLRITLAGETGYATVIFSKCEGGFLGALVSDIVLEITAHRAKLPSNNTGNYRRLEYLAPTVLRKPLTG